MFLHGRYDWMVSAQEERLVYPDIESAQQPEPNCTEVPVPVFVFLPDLTADETLLEAMKDSNSSWQPAWLLKHLHLAQTLNLLVKAN